jgi:hypothetical protein
LRQAVTEGAVRSFQPNFEDRVMSRVRSASAAPSKLEALMESYRWAFGRLAAISVFILIILVAAVLLQDGLFPKDAIFYISDTTVSHILQVPVF